jgi:hypothetical protein
VATRQYREFGIEAPESRVRAEVAPLAERADAAMKNAPPARAIPEGMPLEVPVKRETFRIPVGDENSWSLERATGNASPRAAFHQRPNREAMKKFHDQTMAALRKRLGG